MILGIETVTKIGSLAVVEDSKVLGRITIDTQLRHNAKIISSLSDLLNSLGINISNIDAIAVDIGPGSFTGIRVGLATAMGLAQPDGKQLVGVCSLEVLCQMGRLGSGIKFLVPAIDAKKGLFYSATYELDGREIEKPHITTMESLQKEKLPGSILFGPEIDNTYPDASAVAKIGERKIKEGSVQKNIVPMYLHEIEYRT